MANYEDALEAAGARVLDFEMCGSYQGPWYACIEYNGSVGFIVGSYGSCSYCDGLESAEDKWNSELGCLYRDRTPEQEEKFRAKLAEFGAGYLLEILTLEEVAKRASEEWSSEKTEAMAFVERNRSRFAGAAK